MNRRRLWTLLGCTAGAVVGLYAFAAHGFRHPESWTGRTNHRLCRMIYPSDPTFRTLKDMSQRVVIVPSDEVAAADVTLPPVGGGSRLVPAPEVVAVFEPIVVEAGETTGANPGRGFEESEFPIIRDLPRPRAVSLPNPPRMPYADEAVDAQSKATAELAEAMRELRAALHAVFADLGAGSDAEESESGANDADEKTMPIDPHHGYCPHTGGRMIPSQYRYVEIPSTTPRMPDVNDLPDAGTPPMVDLGEEQTAPVNPPVEENKDRK